MMTNAQEIYTQAVRPLPTQERLRLAALILNELSQMPALNNAPPRKGEKLSDLFGAARLGYPTGADNESIDADLAREYANNHEDES